MASTPPSARQDEHEARIAQLRARRRARVRWLAIRASLIAGALTLAVAGALYWLLATVAGRDALLSQVQQRLPRDASLTWERAEGPASGPLILHGVRFRYVLADDDAGQRDGADRSQPQVLEFTARRALLDPALRPLLGRRLRLDALHIEGARLLIPESHEPFELPRWPESLPAIKPPLPLRADDVRIDGLQVLRRRAAAYENVIDIRRLRGGIIARSGRLRVEKLEADTDRGRFTLHGDYAPRKDYRMDLVATAVLSAPAGRTPPRLGLVARGDLARMDIGLAGYAPAPLRATLTLRGKRNPVWHLRANSEALDPALLTTGEGTSPVAFRLQADGVGGQMELRGELTRDGFNAQVLPSKLLLENQVLQAQPLALRVFDGTATLRGQADFNDPENARLRFAVNARGLKWGGATATSKQPARAARATLAIRADADLGVAGTLQNWAAIGRATLTRDGERALVRFDGRGDAARMQLKSLHAQMPTGTLDAGGDVAWSPALGWKLDATLAGFDPGYFAPRWKGALRGSFTTRGQTRRDGGLDIAVDAPRMEGRLRGRPLKGSGRFVMHGAAGARAGDAYEGDVALTLGSSRIEAQAKVNATLAIDARFAPLQLSDVLPDGAGTLRGTLTLTGARDAPDIEADLTGNGLSYAAYRAQSLSAKGRLPWRGGSTPGALALRAEGLELGVPIQALTLDARGAVQNLQLQAQARGEIGTLALEGQAAKRGQLWQGTLASLQFAPAKGAQWRLQGPAQMRWDGRSGALSNACLAASDGGVLCANADWPRRGLDVRGDGLPLALLQPYLPQRQDKRPWLLRGEVAVNVQLRPVGRTWRGQARIGSASGGMKFSERSRSEILRYSDLQLNATFDPQRLNADMSIVLNEDGRIDARLATGWDAYAPLAGEVAMRTDELTWLELFSPDIVEPRGRLDGRITLSGSRARPSLGGSARLTEFTTEVPALAIVLREGDVRLEALPDGTARIAGSVRSGDGTLAIDGSLGWQADSVTGETRPLLLTLRGRDVLLSDTRDLRAVAHPDVQVRYAARQPIQVTGTVTVPSARIDLERLDEGVSASPDVVVLDPVDPEDTGTLPLDLDLLIAVGDDVELAGFGLEGTLDGQLRVRARPGREMLGSGRLDVAGQYRAYGQELQITRGELLWSNSPIADPILNIRAEREVGEVTAGIDVTGRAASPQANVWSNPASSQSEALSYLALGRPLSNTSGDESRQLNAASAALSAGGSLLASQLGAAIGLDDAGVMESRALGGSVLGVGKYLSPRLYVGYGVSLLGTGQVLTLKYLLRKGFDIEIESSTEENRASLNWRTEK